MNSKNNNQKSKVINIGKKGNKEEKNEIKKRNHNNNNQKKVIESYNTKNNVLQYIKKKINLEANITFEKKNNLSLLSFLSSNTNQDDKFTNKSLKTTKETENNQLNLKYSNINKKKKFFLTSNTISSFNNTHTHIHNPNPKQKTSSQGCNNIILSQELDNFKNRIDGLLKVIEDFETKYIHSNENKRIKEEFNKIINNKKYYEKTNSNININSNHISHYSSKKEIDISARKNQIFFRESNKNIFNKDINNNNNNNKTMILRNHKLNLINNHPTPNNFYSTKNIKNSSNNSTIINKYEKNKNNKNEQYKNINYKNSYNRRINYSTLIEIKSINNEKTQKLMKENKNNKDLLNKAKTKPLTHHYPSKSNDIPSFEYIYNKDKKIKEDNKTKKIFINPSYSRTPKIYRVKKKINKNEKKKSNINNANKKKKFIKK